jgi:hypothetical protein
MKTNHDGSFEDENTELLALRAEIARLRRERLIEATAEAFREYTTADALNAWFGMDRRTLLGMKKTHGLTPVNSGTHREVFRVADIKAVFESKEPLPSRAKKRTRKPGK